MYDDLIAEADSLGLVVREKNLLANDGRIKNNRIAIKKSLTRAEKSCILAEEIGHSIMNVGNILDQNIVDNRKQERKARQWAFKRMITLEKLILARDSGCDNIYDMALFLDVSESFLFEAIETWKSVFGTCVQTENHLITFDSFNIYNY